MAHSVGARAAIIVLGAAVAACSVSAEPMTTFEAPPTTTANTNPPDTGITTSGVGSSGIGTADGSGDDLDEKLDIFDPGIGCNAIDFLFVIDNSESMATYQMALTEQFPDFIGAMYSVLPPGISVHVGLTTTDFNPGCDAIEGTMNCQTDATVDEVEAQYIPPDVTNAMGNGAQGKLFEYNGMRYFEGSSNDDPAALTSWFSEAAVAAGEEGCSFEMPVAAAGYATHPANFENEGFLRDASALLVIFFLTDEPDKSPESKSLYVDMILEAKAMCAGPGGDATECVFVSGLIPSCTIDVNQKLWQFMKDFDAEDPQWGDIELTGEYVNVFGDLLADAIADACLNIPIP